MIATPSFSRTPLGTAPAGVRARAGGAVTAPDRLARPTVAVAGAALAVGAGLVGLRRQAVTAKRRYGVPADPPGPIDLVVRPGAGERADNRLLTVVGLGDSGMAGVGADHLDATLLVQLGRGLADRTRRPVQVIGRGRTGARTCDVLAEQVPGLPANADVIVLMVGTNDVTHATPWRSLAGITATLLDALMATGAPIVLSSRPEVRALRAVPRPLRDAAWARAAGVQRLQRRAALGRPEVTLVDVRGAVGPLFVQLEDAMSVDEFHPSGLGYGLIAGALLPAVLAAVAVDHSGPA